MMVRDWNSFKEPLEHEIDLCSISLDVEGFRVDAKKDKPEGIRDHCCPETEGSPRLKSCDYFYLYGKKFICIEFSDLHRQYIDCNISFQKIKKIIKQLPRKDKRLIRDIEPDKIIFREVTKKFKDTDFLLKTIYDPKFDKIINLPDRELAHYFFVIWHHHKENELTEFHYENELISEIDIVRLIDSIQDKLRIRLSQESVYKLESKDIYILTLKIFQEKYCSFPS